MIRFLRELVFKDTLLKVFSLILAVLTWMALSYIQREGSPASTAGLPSTKITFSNVEVVILSSASDVHDFKVEPKTVEVTVEADVKTIEGLESKAIRAMVDLTGLESGVDVRKRIEISTPPGVKHVKVAPREVRVLFPNPR